MKSVWNLRYLFLVFTLISSFVCFSNQTNHSNSEDLPKNITVFVIGDWGIETKERKSVAFQFQVLCNKMLNSIKKYASLENPSFVISTGDNVYMKGISSTNEGYKIETLLEAYGNPSIPWYAVLGNHDCKGSAKAQVLYNSHSDNNRSI